MANEILIKRSAATVAPSSLLFGEMAFGANGELFIGDNSGAVVKIGGSDTATEDFVTAAVAGLSSSVDTSVSDLQAQINAEVTARTNADTTLQSNIDAEAVARANADTALQNAIDTEVNARTSADTAINGRIDTVEADIANILSNTDPAALDSLTEIVAAFQGADSNLNDAIIQLASDASASRNAIANELDATQVGAGLESDGSYVADATTNYLVTATSLKDADKKLDAALKAEVDARIAAVSALEATVIAELGNLETALDDEVAARTAADTTLQSNIDAEASARVDGDNAVNARIDNLVAGQVAFTPDDSAMWNDPSDVGSVAPSNVDEALERLIYGVNVIIEDALTLEQYVQNLTATAVGFTDTTAQLGAADVQAAIEALKVLVDNVEAGSNTAISSLTADDVFYKTTSNLYTFSLIPDFDPNAQYAVGGSVADFTIFDALEKIGTEVSDLYQEINLSATDAGVVLKSMATQSSTAVAITGGTMENVALTNVTISGALLDGGTF